MRSGSLNFDVSTCFEQSGQNIADASGLAAERAHLRDDLALGVGIAARA